jgi:hypothetical protein
LTVETTERPGPALTFLARLILTPFVLFALLVWAPLGFVFWIPLIARAATTVTLTLLIAALLGRSVPPIPDGLTTAILFWPKGFVIIFSVLTRNEASEPTLPRLDVEFDGTLASLIGVIFSTIIDILRMLFMALFFWGTMALFVHHTGIWRIEYVAQTEARLIGVFDNFILGHGSPRPAQSLSAADDYFTTGEANLRTGPSTSASIVRRLDPATHLRFLSQSGSEWVEVETNDGQRGFVSSSLLYADHSPRN